MKQRIGRKIFKIYAMDIETHNDEESIRKQETSMWLGCFIDESHKVDDESSYFYNMDEFLDALEIESSPKRKSGEQSRPCANVCVYIYNLSFEWSFILPYLLKRGFEFKETIEKEDEFKYNSVSTKSVSSVWNVELKFHKRSGKVIFKDLSKIFGGGLGKVAKSFKLPTQKGEIDYRKNRLHDYVVTDEEREYCFKDTKIIMDILQEMQNRGDKDFFNVMSMASYSMRLLIKRGYPRKVKPYQAFREEYPLLKKEEDDFIRESVAGGITYAPANWQFKVINQTIAHIDAHQMHPSSAFFHLFPYGEGEYFTGKPLLGRICCCRIRISYDDVKLHSVIKLIGLPFIEDKELVVWDFEIPTMFKCYVNLKVEYIDGYAYKMRPLRWRRYYSDNYYKRLEAKKAGDTFGVLYYKLLNNSSYGKLLENPHNIVIKNIIRDDGIIDSITEDKDEEEIKQQAKYTYLPVGSCIPAYSRVALIELALLIGWEYVVYFDTDSIFYIWNEKTKAVWESDLVNKDDFLGGWAMEEFIDKAQFSAPKRYKAEVQGHTYIKAGGINFDEYALRTRGAEIHALMEREGLTQKEAISRIEFPFDEINIVSSKWKVQRAFRVKGGTIIEFQDKEMSIQDKYIEIFKKNMDNISD